MRTKTVDALRRRAARRGKIEPAQELFAMVQDTLEERQTQTVWQWAEDHVYIPLTAGSTRPGLIDTALTPALRDIWDLYDRPEVHFLTIAKSARVGGTLFCIVCAMHKIDVWPGPILWVDPTRKTAIRLSRQEIQPHMRECPPVARRIIEDRESWTTLEMILRNCVFGLVGAGSASELAGRQAELVILNEVDKFDPDLKDEAPPSELAVVRSKQFHHTRKIIRNSTPTIESGEIWTNFLAGSQHYIYLACPLCGEWQRLTFFPEEKEVPFAPDLSPLPDGQRRVEKTGKFSFEHCKDVETGQYDLDRVERETRYQCGGCEGQIDHSSLAQMLRRRRLVAHHPTAPRDHVSVHYWAAYSLFEQWGGTARKFLLSRGSSSKMHDFYNSDLGLPFVRHASAVRDEDIQELIRISPDYELGQLPFEPLFLSMTADVQGDGFWWVIRAWAIQWESDGWPVVSATIDYGFVPTWDQIRYLAGIVPDSQNGKLNVYRKLGGEEHKVFMGLIDSGFEAKRGKGVYAFCMAHRDVFNPCQGAARGLMRGKTLSTTEVEEGALTLVRFEDDFYKQSLYYDLIKERQERHYLPRDICKTYVAQVTSERPVEKKRPNGTTVLEWVVKGSQGNHLGDAEKMQEVIRDLAHPMFEAEREKMAETLGVDTAQEDDGVDHE